MTDYMFFKNNLNKKNIHDLGTVWKDEMVFGFAVIL